MRRKLKLAVSIFSIFIFVALFHSVSDAAQIPDTHVFEKLLPLHEVKKRPGPYDWLSAHPEPGQTFDAYIKSRPVKPIGLFQEKRPEYFDFPCSSNCGKVNSKQRNVIYITLLGDFDPARKKIIRQTAHYMEAFFGLPVKFAPPIPLSKVPKKARRTHPATGDRQILTTYVIDKILKPDVPDDAICLIAFTPSDLWPGQGWNFVFGQASIEDRVGVWSIYRNGDPNKSKEAAKLCLKRTIKTGAHEVGHMFSMHHCVFYECAMNGSNHRKESDERPMWLCPVCLRKLSWAIRFDLAARYRDLSKINGEFGFHAERDFLKKSLEILK